MGLNGKKLKKWAGEKYASYKKKRAESAAYNKILAEKKKVAARQAYAEESVKVAATRARARARAPSVMSAIGSGLSSFGSNFATMGQNITRGSLNQGQGMPRARTTYKTTYKKVGKGKRRKRVKVRTKVRHQTQFAPQPRSAMDDMRDSFGNLGM